METFMTKQNVWTNRTFLFLCAKPAETIKALEGAPLVQHDSIRAAMAAKHRKQLVDVDMKLVKQLDQKVRNYYRFYWINSFAS